MPNEKLSKTLKKGPERVNGKYTLWGAFAQHRRDSKGRNIPFLLTPDEWLKIWLDSGHLEERGARKGQYVMARFGDKGPYAVGNVKIILCEENHSEDNLGSTRTISIEQRKLISNVNSTPWITDGASSRKLKTNEAMPKGWWFGRTPTEAFYKKKGPFSIKHRRAISKAAKGKRYITNGTVTKKISVGNRPPKGWRFGIADSVKERARISAKVGWVKCKARLAVSEVADA